MFFVFVLPESAAAASAAHRLYLAGKLFIGCRVSERLSCGAFRQFMTHLGRLAAQSVRPLVRAKLPNKHVTSAARGGAAFTQVYLGRSSLTRSSPE
jgi:hypothetical protein